MKIVVTDRDVNEIPADAIVIPVDASLRAERRLAASVLQACDPAVGASLGRLADVAFMGVAPGTVLRLPAVSHPRVELLLLLVLFDGRDGHVREPDEARIEGAARVLAGALSTLALDRVVITNLAGRRLDGGEVAATVVAAARRLAVTSTLIFCDIDPVTRHDMGAAIESLGVEVTRTD